MTATPDPAADTKETTMPEPTSTSGVEDPEFTDKLLSLADHLGMDQEVSELRAAINQRECVERIVRICQLAGLPISRDGGPGIVIRPVNEPDPASRRYLAGGVTVSWQVSPELDQASEDAEPGAESDKLYYVLHQAMELMLATLLQQGGCATVLDSLAGDLIVRAVSDPGNLDALYRTPDPEPGAPGTEDSGRADR